MPQPSASTRHERIRVSHACDSCREKKAKCDGAEPECGRCRQRSSECHYSVTKRVQNQQVMKALATKVAQYESMLQKSIPARQLLYQQNPELNDQPMMESDGQTASQHVDSTRSPTTPPSIDAALTASNSESASGHLLTMHDDIMSTTTTTSPLVTSQKQSDIESPTSTVASTEERWGQGFLDTVSIPPRSTLVRASRAFFEAAAMLFTFFDEDEWSELLESIYGKEGEQPPKIALAQVCATAAVGCQYYPQKFDEYTKLAFISIAKLKLEDCVEEAPLPSMRIMALMCLYFTFENRTSATMYVGMGLRLAKMNRDLTTFYDYPSTPWQRVFNSLVFLDCWLCANTGMMPSSQHWEWYSLINTIGTKSPPVNTAIQFEMIKISILSNSILQNVFHARFFSTKTVNGYKNQLQQWLLTLPNYMRLDYILSSNGQKRHLRSIFVVHLLYLDTVILAYRRVLAELGYCGYRLTDPDAFEQTLLFLEPCLWTGRQVAKILEIALSQGQVLQKCWLYIHTVYSTCTVLLYFITNRLMHGDLSEELSADFEAAQQCMDVLSYCAEVDKFAKTYLENVTFIHRDLIQIRSSVTGLSQNVRVLDEMPEHCERLHQLTALCASFLIHPFDGGFRRVTKILQDAVTSPNQARTGISAKPESGMDMTENGLQSSEGERRTLLPDSSQIFWKDFLCLRDLLSIKQDNGKGKEANSDASAFPFLSPGGAVFGS